MFRAHQRYKLFEFADDVNCRCSNSNSSGLKKSAGECADFNPNLCLNAASSLVPFASDNLYSSLPGGSLELCLPPPWKLWELAMRLQKNASVKF